MKGTRRTGHLFSPKVFVDTSAWVALLNSRDGLYPRAVECWGRLCEERRFLLSNDYVLDETLTLLRRSLGGLALCRTFHEKIERSRVIEVQEVDEELRRQAWRYFFAYQD